MGLRATLSLLYKPRFAKVGLELAFTDESRSEAPRVSAEGTETLTAKRGRESPAIGEQLMEEVCERENCKQALARVKANKGSPGADGMTVEELPDYLKQHWPAIREQLLSGTYTPQPVKRVRSSISPRGTDGWWTWIWRNSSIE
jgi:hypothetical protein